MKHNGFCQHWKKVESKDMKDSTFSEATQIPECILWANGRGLWGSWELRAWKQDRPREHRGTNSSYRTQRVGTKRQSFCDSRDNAGRVPGTWGLSRTLYTGWELGSVMPFAFPCTQLQCASPWRECKYENYLNVWLPGTGASGRALRCNVCCQNFDLSLGCSGQSL
jgi:hypothetical protein